MCFYRVWSHWLCLTNLLWSFSVHYLEWNSNHFSSYRSNHRRCSVRKGVLRNFAKFTGKHLCQSLFCLFTPARHIFRCFLSFCRIVQLRRLLFRSFFFRTFTHLWRFQKLELLQSFSFYHSSHRWRTDASIIFYLFW